MKSLVRQIRTAKAKLQRWLFYARLRRLGVTLGEGCRIALGSKLSSQTKIGDFTNVTGPSVFKGSAPIVIGKYCAIGEAVRVISSNHGTGWANLQNGLQNRLGLPYTGEGRQVTIGNNVWIGDAAIILSGVTVGDGAVLGAGSIVTKDVPAFAIVAGSPARLIRMRFSDEVIAQLSGLAWWNWTEEEMRKHSSLFATEISGELHL
jgi:acetyltransferase-like isoleucine patch superfamily enzyme